MLPWLLAMAFVVLMQRKRHTPKTPPTSKADAQRVVRAVAERLGVEPAIALAFAELESGFNAHAAGDLDWATRRAAKYRELVLDAPKFARNPKRTDPSVWHSYGLFGLLAPYHIGPDEDPEVLWDPVVNAERGVQAIKRLLVRTNGDVAAARLAYVGCGSKGQKCSDEYSQRVLERLAEVYGRWAALERGGVS